MEETTLIQCVLCGHKFHPGGVDGFVYCSACGRRFNPDSPAEETVLYQPGDTDGPPTGVQVEFPPAPNTNRRFGEYDIIDEIARGGMGVVYLARQRVLKRVVALKVLRSGDNASDEERERLLREAKAAAGLSHPNIVPIHEFSIHQGQPYFTMDYIDGDPLDRLLEQGPLKVRDAVEIIETVSRAISYAHARGIIHRDLKPANIIITPDGRPMITDFGLAVERTTENENMKRMTMAGSVMGTIPYAPPEQAAGKIDQISERSDVYSMGAVLYEMVTGRPPFNGFTQFDLMRRVINHDPTPPRQINPKVHRDVETIILKCLEKEQRRRYANAKAFADDCQSFLKGEVITARPATLGYRCRRFITRRPLLNLMGALVVILSLSVWVFIDHFHALAKEKEATELEKREAEERLEQTLAEKKETERQLHREWRTEYNINFDYYFRWESDLEVSRQHGLPWLNPQNTRPVSPSETARVKLLADPPRLALTDPEGSGAGPETPYEGKVDLGLPFAFPREARVVLRMQTPRERVGELILSLDVDKDYKPQLGTTTARFGSAAHPGINFYRGEAIIGEDAAFYLRPGVVTELILERSDDRIRAYLDGRLVLESEDPPAVFSANTGRMTIDVKDGTLEFMDLSVDLRGMSRSVASSLIETANSLSAQGRPEMAMRLYVNVLLEPTDPQNHLRALRGYARSLWMGLGRNQRSVAGIEKACHDLSEQLAAAGRITPGEIDYLVGLALAFDPSQRAGVQALDRLNKASAIAYSSSASDYGDLARLETIFVYLRMGKLEEAARLFDIMYEDGTTRRLYERFGAELSGGGHVALLLEKVDPLIRSEESLDTAATLLKAAAAIAPSSRECSNYFRRLGRVQANQKRFDKAVEYLHWSERLSPDWFRPYLEEARIHFDAGKVGRAEEALARGRTAIPQSLDLHLGIARMYLDELPEKQRDPAKAEQAARVSITLTEKMNPVAWELLAQALEKQNRLDEAMEAIEEAIRLETNAGRTGVRDALNRKLFGRQTTGTKE